MKKLIVAQDLEKGQLELIQQAAPQWEIITGKEPEQWENHLESAEIIAGWKTSMKEAALEKETALRWIQTWSAGVDSMPLDQLDTKDILLTSANGVHAYPISETIFAMMLGLTRKIHTYIRNQDQKEWAHSGLKLEIHGKTIGIIGVGAIGKETAKIAQAFGMKVLGVRHSGKGSEHVDEMFRTEQLHEVLPRCDYVVNTVPLTPDTSGMFGKREFEDMKDTAFLINIGRGETVKEAELIEALQTKKIAGAGLDVFETEPLKKDSPLWEMENVIITPHTAGSTEFYNKRVIEDIFIPNLKEYISGNPPPVNLVDYRKGY
ncbi:D-2-hydroxyacid dehydrogenase [Rossellomorea vietnamensis]|uniref:D-2-hydroxyacid dehydrogenase n=1 Tax=Rossellomorea vietnamensis TaxID=218284 RepID=A0A5D4M8U5_9BACI|nr:D-2-hydroxyacid dehydrogenase [Rossellomorea vietnamensis]TYR98036.1 D-2-hydroxyacid dehydrogenase [Rossellomorea vietnamensis]